MPADLETDVGPNEVVWSPPTTAPVVSPPHGAARMSAAPWIGFPLGVLILHVSYWFAARSSPGDSLHFTVFWVGIASVLVPVGWRLLGVLAGPAERRRLVAALGAFTYVPKLLGYSGSLAYFDEIGHLTQTERLVDDGLLFVRNSQIVVISDYPGLHSLAASVHHLTAIPLVGVAHLLLVMMHVVALVGVFQIVMTIAGSARSAGIAALVYSIGPGFWFFNAQFAYESFALVMFIWILVGLLAIMRRAEPGTGLEEDEHRGGLMITGALVVTITATHHLTSYLLVATLFLLAVGAWALVRLRRTRVAVAAAATVGCVAVALVNLAWFLTQAPTTRGYVSPYVADSASDFISLVTTLGEAEATDDLEDPGEARSLFAGSTLPTYEIILGLASPILLFGLATWSMIRARRVLVGGAGPLGFALLTVAYFAVLPLVFSEAGAEIARRSWSFSGVGLAVVIGLGLGLESPRPRSLRRSWMRRCLALGLLCATMVGNTATGINEVYRFPGPFVYGSDTRSATAEVRASADWFARTYGENQGVIAERTVLLFFGSDARARWALPNGDNRQWDVILGETGPTRGLLESLLGDGIDWIVIDRRQAEFIPLIGFYVDQNEPLARARTEALDVATVNKFAESSWLTKVFGSTHYDIYRISGELSE